MGIESAVQAYRESAYQKLELDIDASIGRASMPFFGGLSASLLGTANLLLRPFQVVSGLILGGHYSPESIKQTQIPEDVQGTKYAQALGKTREYGRQSADLRAESMGRLFRGDFGGFFRERRAASYNDSQKERVILPDEGRNLGETVIHTGALIGSNLLMNKMFGSNAFDPDMLGALTPSMPVLGSRAIANIFV